MIVSTKGRYALRVMIDLAEHQMDRYIPLKEIAERQDISEKYLEAIIKTLVRAKLLLGLRGKGGGYQLSREPEQYTAGEIVRVAEGGLASVACLMSDAEICSRAANCKTLPMWKKLDRLVNDFLDSYTLASLMNVKQTGDDYVI